MIFAVSDDGDTMMLFFSDNDVAELKRGLTKFIDDRHTMGRRFSKVVTAYFPTDDEALAAIKKYARGSPTGVELKPTEPRGGEAKCEGCQGVMPSHLILDGKCIVCWREAAITTE